MKYIKTYEDKQTNIYNIGDYIKLNKEEAWRIWRIFDIAKIIDKDYYDKSIFYQYKIEAINEDNFDEFEIVECDLKNNKMNNIGHILSKKNFFIERKATPNEIEEFETKKDSMKYNL
jgi:hypothetical protein